MQSGTTTEGTKAGHRVTVAVLLFFGTLLAFLAIFSIWVNRQALNTDNWVHTSERLLQDEEVKSRLSNYLADQLFANVDVQAELEETFPPQLAPLAGPAAGALHQLAPEVAERVLASSQAETAWSEANRRAHETLLKVLNDEGSAVSTSGGEVTLDLNALLVESGGQLAGKLASKVPPDAAQLTILKSDQLSAAQDISKLVRHLPVVLTLLTIVFYGLAIYLAGPRRRQALRSVGLGFLVAGVLVLILRSVAGSAVVDALAANEAAKPAAESVWEIGTSLLATVATSAVAFGLLVFLGAWLAGPTSFATGTRRLAAPYLREQELASAVVAVAVFLALIAWAPISAFQKPLGILLFAILFGVGAELLRRQALREFPDAVRGEASGSLRERWSGPRAPEPSGPSDAQELERLSALRRSGDLSATEFDAAKAQVLSTQTKGVD